MGYASDDNGVDAGCGGVSLRRWGDDVDDDDFMNNILFLEHIFNNFLKNVTTSVNTFAKRH